MFPFNFNIQINISRGSAPVNAVQTGTQITVPIELPKGQAKEVIEGKENGSNLEAKPESDNN